MKDRIQCSPRQAGRMDESQTRSQGRTCMQLEGPGEGCRCVMVFSFWFCISVNLSPAGNKRKQIYFYTPPTPALKPSWALEKDRWCSQKGLCSAVFLDGFLETGWRAGEKEAKPPCLTESHKWYAGVKWQRHCHSWWLSGTQKDRPNNHLEP